MSNRLDEYKARWYSHQRMRDNAEEHDMNSDHGICESALQPNGYMVGDTRNMTNNVGINIT